jgi:hypothetical protein
MGHVFWSINDRILGTVQCKCKYVKWPHEDRIIRMALQQNMKKYHAEMGIPPN